MSTDVNQPDVAGSNMVVDMDDPPYKKLKLSLERPYKDDNGLPIPDLLDITPDGQHIYAPSVPLKLPTMDH